MEKSYYAIIPASVRYDKTLPSGAKLLYGEISALCNEKGYCWATNSYFAELYQITPRSVSDYITKLEEAGHIRRQLSKSKEELPRKIFLTNKMTKIENGGILKNEDTRMNEFSIGYGKNVLT